ncbi:DNA polymerase II large subunit [Candidatus Micrarchaeota archaeon]|nr:DNA polymerase II large subunit [Candidatus Micrarchaeota archaeon]MBU1930355.1 DNA polymerase II large subunit [Candidatus Micrarchaeota archaeon]
MEQKKFDLKLNIIGEPHIKRYYDCLLKKVQHEISLAQQAKAGGIDIHNDIETTPALDLADRTESIIGPKGISKRYREEFAKTNDRLKAIFTIFKEIIEQCDWYQEESPAKRLDQAIRTSLVLLTEGVVVAPLDGVPQIKISENPDKTKYVDIYFAGPIRAAGGTATVFPLVLGDYARQLLGLDRYKPTQEEIERYVEETGIYDEIVSRQYKLKPNEVRKIIANCPVCVNGEPTEDREVSVHRDLERIATNQIRGGACLVISEGIALKAMKIIKFAKQLGLDWNWLEDIIKIEKKGDFPITIKPNTKFLERMAAGRPIFCYPMRPGGFRLRYGRSRNAGAMGKAIHPATMRVLDDFIAVGTQIKVERPGKAAGITPCDSIEGPIVRLYNGKVLQIQSSEQALKLKPQIEKILFLGDILVPIGDFRKSGHPFMPVGYCEEWWQKELRKALQEGKKTTIETKRIIENPKEVSSKTAIQLSQELGIPLHSKFLFYYTILEKSSFMVLQTALQNSKQIATEKGIILEIENKTETKKCLETIGCPHELSQKNQTIRIEPENGLALLKTFGILDHKTISAEAIEKGTILELLSQASGLTIKDKGGTFIGSRMGRPEAARPRKMIGNPHLLFPIGLYGGPTRSINKAANANEKNAFSTNTIEVELALFKCPDCQKIVEFSYCTHCRTKTKPIYYCKNCKIINATNSCFKCNAKTQRHNLRKINLAEILETASKNLGVKTPEIVKGVKGMINETKVAEPLEKGILRARKDLHVFRDATIRYEMLNAALTHFKPREIGTPVEKLCELGYEKDINGKQLEHEEQILELFPQDIVINKDSGDFFIRVTQFIDELLSRYYGTKEYYKKTKREELIGELMLGLAPHTSAAIVGRIIGYSKAKLGFGHPYFHLAKRRNIDGDQDSVMLLMDGLLNFSHSYLPSSRGGRMDAPLVFTIALTPNEIDDEVYEMETCKEYPLELYEKSQQIVPPESVDIEIVKKRLGKENQYSGFQFTHSTNTFDEGPARSKYVTLQTMEEKIRTQAKLQQKITAVDFKDSMEIVMMSHFLPDIIGNTRSFSRQNFRCTKCQAKYRRVPLLGKCRKCKGNVILTIAQGSVKKYLKLAKDMVQQYQLSHYLKQRLDLVEEEIDSVFKPEKTTQKSLFEFA